jgi:hypothetical protein
MQRDPRRSIDLGHDPHATSTTCGAAVDINAREPKKLLGYGFLFERPGLGDGGRE